MTSSVSSLRPCSAARLHQAGDDLVDVDGELEHVVEVLRRPS